MAWRRWAVLRFDMKGLCFDSKGEMKPQPAPRVKRWGISQGYRSWRSPPVETRGYLSRARAGIAKGRWGQAGAKRLCEGLPPRVAPGLERYWPTIIICAWWVVASPPW
ncbi:hypothetical protein GCM10008997_03810 [Halomonas salifodinae]